MTRRTSAVVRAEYAWRCHGYYRRARALHDLHSALVEQISPARDALLADRAIQWVTRLRAPRADGWLSLPAALRRDALAIVHGIARDAQHPRRVQATTIAALLHAWESSAEALR